MSPLNRVTVALYCTTALPIIVAVTSVAVNVGAMAQETASVLVSAGAITVFLMPLLASVTYRVVDAKPIVAVKEIAKNPREAGAIVRDHIALERMLIRQDRERGLTPFSRVPSQGSPTAPRAKAAERAARARELVEAIRSAETAEQAQALFVQHAESARAARAERVAQLFERELRRRDGEFGWPGAGTGEDPRTRAKPDPHSPAAHPAETDAQADPRP